MAEIFLDPAAAITFRALLLALRDIVAWLVAVALIALAVAIAETILWPLNKFVQTITFGAVGSVPGSGAVINFLTGQLKSAVKDLDHACGSFWHAAKKIVSQVAEELFGLAVLSEYLYWWAIHKLGVSLLHAGQALLRRLLKSVTARVHHLEARVKHLVHEVESVGQGIYPRLRTLEHEVEKTLPREIRRTRELAKEAEAEAASAWDYLRSHPWTAVTDAFVGAVAIALGRLGFGGFKCPAFGNVFGKRGCGLWNALDDVLGLLVDGLVFANLCTVIPVVEGAFAEFEGPLVGLISDAANAVCARPPASWGPLPHPPLYLPPAADLTLHLP